MGNRIVVNYSEDIIPDMGGRVFFVTGCNTGLGRDTARQLLEHNATVIATARPGKVEAMVEDLRQFIGSNSSARVEGLPLDLGDLASVRACANQFRSLELPLHVLINNAGVMMCPLGYTKDGFETQFGVNHVGHFLLTQQLFPALVASSTEDAPSRVVTLSSSYHSKGPREGILFDNLTWDESKPGPAYDIHISYGHSKFANLVFAQELHARSTAKYGKAAVASFAVHPGFVDTDLTRHREAEAGKCCVDMFKCFSGALRVEVGALTQVYCATSTAALRTSNDSRFFEPVAVASQPYADAPEITPQLRERLWTVTEELIGEKFEV